MVFQKLGTKYPNYFYGGYISSLLKFEDADNTKSYMSIGVNTNYKGKPQNIKIMVYKEKGYKDKKYPNPAIKIICDCYEQGKPIAICYYDKGSSKIESVTYTNFSVDKHTESDEVVKKEVDTDDFTEIKDIEDLPF